MTKSRLDSLGLDGGAKLCELITGRRALLGLSGLAAVAPALGASPTMAAVLPATGMEGIVSVKDARFGARGDGGTDDTDAIQKTVDFCFGPPSSPHGNDSGRNRTLYFPPGRFRITRPIAFSKLRGVRVVGSGRFVTGIVNSAGGGVFVTNGCGYSHFEGLHLHSDGKTSTIFDLSWDGTAGGAALQSNTFIDIMFAGGGIGLDIGAGGFMGSENLLLNCFWIRNAIAGVKTSNFNALQNTIVGGNLQTCNTGIWVQRGSVGAVQSVGFQESKEWDVRVDNSANDTICIVGCRTESSNFVHLRNYVHCYVAGCSQTEAGRPGYFLQPAGCPATVERCISLNGQIALSREARLSIRGCSFGRLDWLNHGSLASDSVIELEDIQYGGTPNSYEPGKPRRIAKQRIIAGRRFDYVLQPA